MPSSPRNIELARRLAGRFLGELPVSLAEQSGGLSGANVWRIESARGTFALRQHPVEFPTEERLRWLHRILKEVRDRGCMRLPCPVATGAGATWIKHEEQLWELLTWVPGEPLLETAASGELLAVAARSLAGLHRVLETVPWAPLPEFRFKPGHVPGLLERQGMLRQWFAGEEQQLAAALTRTRFPEVLAQLFATQQQALHQHGVVLNAQLEAAVQLVVPLFPVLRDVRPAHVIYDGSGDPGFIDVGSLRPDSASADLARLLQNWRYTQRAWYAAALDAYNEQRRLSPSEMLVLNAYDSSARLLTGVQWLRWLVLEVREFSPALLELHLPIIIQRLQEFSAHALGR